MLHGRSGRGCFFCPFTPLSSAKIANNISLWVFCETVLWGSLLKELLHLALFHIFIALCVLICRHSRGAYGGESPIQRVNSSSPAVAGSYSTESRAIYFWQDTYGTCVPERSS